MKFKLFILTRDFAAEANEQFSFKDYTQEAETLEEAKESLYSEWEESFLTDSNMQPWILSAQELQVLKNTIYNYEKNQPRKKIKQVFLNQSGELTRQEAEA